jgi:hypothetical protein
LLELNKKELSELRILACLNRDTKETSDFADRLTDIELDSDYKTNLVFKVSTPKRTLTKFVNYSLDWNESDSLGVKLRKELANRT